MSSSSQVSLVPSPGLQFESGERQGARHRLSIAVGGRGRGAVAVNRGGRVLGREAMRPRRNLLRVGTW